MSASILPTESLTGVETILKSFPFATFFMVLFVVVLKTDHAIALYDMAAYELGIGRIQLFLLFFILLFIGTIFWKLLSAYIKSKKEAVRREIVGDTERLSLIRLFDATGNIQNTLLYTKFFVIVFIIICY
jgi:cbb3-type cytochrome oxidase subunit 3